ncbi:hypothetical protein F5148DRAFT_1377366 [Russula earlei]|uniref:Uncharacterized protein n=1 Tax=Russula earlei TaxID=71964 RepID=A0ACC0U4E0_9AGAM|nr:hypothetical protein F5148DRAFT_1377366 [Russula earlei]
MSTTNSVDPPLDSNPHIGAIDVSSTSRAMSTSTVDGSTESDRFMSLPGTPPADGESTFWEDSDPLPGPPQGSESTDSDDVASSLTESSTAKMPSPLQEQEQSLPPEDTSCPIKGMYRLLDLITEQGSSGLVDKIVIAQQSLQGFINALSPGAYSSITKVNFRSLDKFFLKPIGVYGSKEEIVRFLRDINAMDDNTARTMLMPPIVGAEPILKSGLYVVRSFVPTAEEQAYVLYWPEETTWNDQAVPTVKRNRVTFMRYLTKLCDQIVCLLSPEHTKGIVWGEEHRTDKNKSGRVFDFVVAKTHDQEENVIARPGFTMDSPLLFTPPLQSKSHVDPKILSPRLLHGESNQGFMTANFKQAKTLSEPFSNAHQSASQIRLRLDDDVVLCLSDTIDDKSLETLMELGLKSKFPSEYTNWRKAREEIAHRFQETLVTRQEEMNAKLEQDFEGIRVKLREAVVVEVLKAFPSVPREAVLQKSSSSEGANPKDLDKDADNATDPLQDLFRIFPDTKKVFRNYMRTALGNDIKDSAFQSKKIRMVILYRLLDNFEGLDASQICDLANAVLLRRSKETIFKLLKDFGQGDKGGNSSRIWQVAKAAKDRVKNAVGMGEGSKLTDEETMWKNANKYGSSLSDSDFLKQLRSNNVGEFLPDFIADVEETACACLKTQIDALVTGVGSQIFQSQQGACNGQLQREVSSTRDKELGHLRSEFVRRAEDLSRERTGSRRTVFIDRFESKKEHYYSPESYFISGRQESLQNQEIEYEVHTLRLLADHRHNLQLDPSFVPTPMVNDRLSQSFRVSSDIVVRYAHLLKDDRILLGLVDSVGNIMILLERLNRIDAAINNRSYAKFFHQEKIGQTCLIAFDESKRMLAVYASARMQLHVFVFDEELKTLRGQGPAIDLQTFYRPGVSIIHACFIHGSEEILFVDSGAQARVFSLTSLQTKPASLQLPQVPHAIYSSPDGSCLLAVQQQDGVSSLMAYHWSTFASTSGISVALPDFPVDLNGALLTSIVHNNNIHLIGLDLKSQSCRSVVLNITRKATEFTFQEQQSKASSKNVKQTVHNCLIGCHADVWTRFPVVPAVKRDTITSSSERQRKALLFVTDDDKRPFSSHFSDYIHTFERASRKPTGNELSGISIGQSPVSEQENGWWICYALSPIQIAITHENRFVPLKDGVISAQLEKSLLGAEVNRIVDSLSLGWYESIFQSYWASKPVKVVSSMGEQSVGKSFTLNHLVDTSFAGSAMRTTEGVWMSVSPTDDALIVALDFEGVHSLERSAQEDTLLVLFNTAISNLVLFRNNFALSRDITGLFQSFQSSSTVLDPASNPSLFQSTLVVIIKDVIDSDAAEVTREFSLKFQKIVQDEQDANFISRLHAGKLQIIPWPVIESEDFYNLFATLKWKLDQQSISHHTAGEFLHTLKTLMAKLKANDWGALSRGSSPFRFASSYISSVETMAAHRANTLLAILPNAFETGFSEVFPEPEPLKNLDTDLVIEAEDTEAHFLLAGPDAPVADRELRLRALRESWDRINSRQLVDDSEWTSDLAQYLTQLVDLRVAHVDKWLKSNVQRFQAGHASVEDLRRTFDSAVIDLRASIQLCRSQCNSCNLLCVQGRLHEGHHDCLTSHECIHDCTFCEQGLYTAKSCGQTAGHSGRHVCRVDAHLCGEPCAFSGKQGCVGECVKAIAHEDEHVCSAPVHMCGQPCDLIGLKLPNGPSFTCSGTCRVPMNEEHMVHACEYRLCPVSCQLCKRLCSGDHLHGLVPNQSHLCGQEHSCNALCSAQGICQIDTTPQSIEATFTGRHETFQYTKYTQSAKRLRCVKIIEPGEVEHPGPHIHSNEKQPFHFCESRCETCGYLCTHPLGHPQQEHETRHGSMSRTRWAIDGPDGTSLELEGRKFSSNDDGAPMLCNLVCTSMERHVHIDYCRGCPCDNPELQHINERMVPNPDMPKDWITHGLHWRRMGFKGDINEDSVLHVANQTDFADPYPREEQANFSKCDAMCPGPEHTTDVGGPNAKPSSCTLPLFHGPLDDEDAHPGPGYVSNDGHHFSCKNPIVMQQAFHVIFVIDRSGSMCQQDRYPLPTSAGTDRIAPTANDRLGSVFSALYSFWLARQAAINRNARLGGARRDAYSLVFFNHEPSTSIENDFASSPDELLTTALQYEADGGTDFTRALESAQSIMDLHWSNERTPVVIFLSDGEDYVEDDPIFEICRRAVQRGFVVFRFVPAILNDGNTRRPLSFHAVSFGQDSASSSLRRMAQVALDVQQNNAVEDPLLPATATVPSSYTEALDTVRLAETFLGLAESLRKPRGFLFSTHHVPLLLRQP